MGNSGKFPMTGIKVPRVGRDEGNEAGEGNLQGHKEKGFIAQGVLGSSGTSDFPLLTCHHMVAMQSYSIIRNQGGLMFR